MTAATPRTKRRRAARLTAAALLSAVSLGMLPAGAAAAPGACPGAGLTPTGANSQAIDAATLCLIDAVRASRGRHRLRSDVELARVAASQVSSMIRFNYFADIRPSGQTPLSLVALTRYLAHASRFRVAQNIAWATGSYSTPAHVVAEWMASPPHRQIIMSAEYRDAGVGVRAAVPSILRVGRSGATYAIEFAVRRF